MPLAVRLKLPADGAAEGSLLPVQLLRKYIAYAREHVHPVLSDEAKDILQVSSDSFFVGNGDTNHVPHAGYSAELQAASARHIGLTHSFLCLPAGTSSSCCLQQC